MKHYFYFKKGQMVPQWLLRQRDADTKEVLSMAQFKVNGKVLVNDETGDAIIWPASQRFQALIHVERGNLTIDSGGAGYINSIFWGSSPRTRGWGTNMISPLTHARRVGLDVRSTTRCKPLPDNFNRRGGTE